MGHQFLFSGGRIQLVVSNEVCVHQSLTNQPSNNRSHLNNSVLVADVVPKAELLDISIQVLGTQSVKSPLIRSFQHSPE